MDFLDSIDTKYYDRKSNRVRSWYLYEQLKTLEKNQLDAAQKLTDKTYQEKILLQEINERRSRRHLYDQNDTDFDDVQKTVSECSKSLNINNSEDFFESLHELQDDFVDGSFSQDDSWVDKSYSEEFKSLDLDNIDANSCSDSVNSVIDNFNPCEILAADIEDKLKLLEDNFSDVICQQNEPENTKSLENFNYLKDDKISECESLYSVQANSAKIAVVRHRRHSDITVYNIWSRLVAFSYQVIRLQYHGNCYYDYGSQLLTAILACDVLRRGVSKMCDILQPYVSPIKYTEDSEDSISSYKSTKRKRSSPLKNTIKTKTRKYHSCGTSSKPNVGRSRYSENHWRKLSKYSSGQRAGPKYRASEPCRSTRKLSNIISSDKSSDSVWPSFSKGSACLADCRCPCHARMNNPMLKIGQYIDKLLKEIDD